MKQDCLMHLSWAAWGNTWLFIKLKLTLTGVVLSFLFLFFSLMHL